MTGLLDAASRYGRTLPSATGKFATVGFCWGGAQSFTHATLRPWPATVDFLKRHLQ